MNLVDDIDFEPAFGGIIANLVHNLADVRNTVVGGRIELDDVHGRAGVDGLAHGALIAGIAVNRVLAVDGLRKQLCHRSLSGAPGSAEAVRMADTAGPQLVPEGCDHGVLALDLVKGGRAEFAIQRNVSHALLLSPAGSPAKYVLYSIA